MWTKLTVTAAVFVIPFITCVGTYALQCAMRPPQPPFERWMKSNGYSIYIVVIVLVILLLAGTGAISE